MPEATSEPTTIRRSERIQARRPFLNLPPELRIMIYEYTLGDISRRLYHCQSIPPLLHVSQFIRQEALDVLRGALLDAIIALRVLPNEVVMELERERWRPDRHWVAMTRADNAVRRATKLTGRVERIAALLGQGTNATVTAATA